ncbi:MAG: phosphonate metabolism protein PhnM [Spirochaetota bacterium]
MTNGRIITEDAILDDHDLVVEGDRIAAIVPSAERRAAGASDDGAPDHGTPGRFRGPTVIDAEGGYVMPGLIDIHADYIEHMAAPRPTSVMDFRLSLREAERELVTHGITTMYHSLAIYDFTEFNAGPIRTPENTQRLISLIGAMHDSPHIIRHRFHARFEIDNLSRVDELRGYIRDGQVHLISFMDHTPGQGQYRDLELYRKTLKSYRKISDDEVVQIIEKSRNRQKLTIEAITELATYAREHGIAVASHDDDSVAKLELVREFGTTISEFPVTLEVARAARDLGLHTIAGAPNILLGGSHSGNLSAAEAVLDGSVDVLCSDYYPPALIHSVFQLHHAHGLDLPSVVRLVTTNPARAVLMDDELGSLEPGKRADIIVVKELEDGYPAVTRAIVGGAVVHATAYRQPERT